MNKKRIVSVLAAVMLAALLLALCACSGAPAPEGVPEIGDLKYENTVPLKYADQFSIYKYSGGYSLIDIPSSGRILIVPEGGEVPAGLDGDITVVRQPLDGIYLVATSPMALFDALGALDSIAFVGSKTWYTESASRALEEGKFKYAGKYNAPDYEMLINGSCRLAIESTMILHNPEVYEKMLELGINTVIERSSYEDHPLGRTEWIKVYGALLGKEAEAEAVFEAEAAKIRDLEALEPTGKTAAFFYINTAGNVVTYKTDGYVPAMIRIAGGEYIFSDLGLDDDSKLSTVNMSMEQFYNTAKNADYIIYNCSIVSQLYELDDLLDRSAVLEDFKAVKEGNVWCTTDSMFQQTDKMGSIIQEMNSIFSGQTDGSDLQFMFRLE
ncbi:MAG: ABC transporter substrate-binding protein [Oscillospiraceae bacterium]|nr:ABC transporter substrate-binding protein [Oscillospiraceae bacterium]